MAGSCVGRRNRSVRDDSFHPDDRKSVAERRSGCARIPARWHVRSIEVQKLALVAMELEGKVTQACVVQMMDAHIARCGVACKFPEEVVGTRAVDESGDECVL